jgi:hypothetical protein
VQINLVAANNGICVEGSVESFSAFGACAASPISAVTAVDDDTYLANDDIYCGWQRHITATFWSLLHIFPLPFPRLVSL